MDADHTCLPDPDRVVLPLGVPECDADGMNYHCLPRWTRCSLALAGSSRKRWEDSLSTCFRTAQSKVDSSSARESCCIACRKSAKVIFTDAAGECRLPHYSFLERGAGLLLRPSARCWARAWCPMRR